MKDTQSSPSEMPTCFYVMHKGEEYNFTIETQPNFLPHDGVFAVIVANERNKNNLFRTLMDKLYDFDSIDEVTKESLLEGYCIYNIGFAEAMILGEMASCESIFYRHTNKIGNYSTASKEALEEIFFE